jgi:hypothetical protein
VPVLVELLDALPPRGGGVPSISGPFSAQSAAQPLCEAPQESPAREICTLTLCLLPRTMKKFSRGVGILTSVGGEILS